MAKRKMPKLKEFDELDWETFCGAMGYEPLTADLEDLVKKEAWIFIVDDKGIEAHRNDGSGDDVVYALITDNKAVAEAVYYAIDAEDIKGSLHKFGFGGIS